MLHLKWRLNKLLNANNSTLLSSNSTLLLRIESDSVIVVPTKKEY